MEKSLVVTNYGLFVSVEVYATIKEIAENKFQVEFYEDCGGFNFGYKKFNTIEEAEQYISETVRKIKELSKFEQSLNF